MSEIEVIRCSWGNSKNSLYQKYHDQEWGKLNLDSTYLYEMLVLESFQSGLSWETILNKRENFRKAFANFDYHKVAKFNKDDFERLMQDEGIVRNRLKINAAINNAKILVKLEKENRTFEEFLTERQHFHPYKIRDICQKEFDSFPQYKHLVTRFHLLVKIITIPMIAHKSKQKQKALYF